MRRSLNVRVLLILLLVLAVVGTGGFFLHQWQVQRHIQIFLQKAEQATADKEPQKAREYLERYLLLQPNNVLAMNKYAILLDETANSPPEKVRAFLKLEQALRQYTSLKGEAGTVPPELHKRAATRAHDLKRFRDVETHLAPLLVTAPKDVDLLQLKADSLAGLGETEKAIAVYSAINEISPTHVKSFIALADLESSSGKKDQAERTLNKMIELNPRSAEARLARSSFLSAQGKVNEAKADLEVAINFSGKDQANADILLRSADVAAEEKGVDVQRKQDEVRKFLTQGKVQFPKDVRFYVRLAQLDLSQGQTGKASALELLRQAIPLVGDDVEYQFRVAKLLLDAGDKVQAVKLIDTLRNRYGATPVLEYFRARLLADEGKTGEIVSILERIKDGLIRTPMIAIEADLLLAAAYEQLGNPDRRLAALERILKVESDIPKIQVGKADTLVALGRLNDALEIYRKQLPKVPEVRFPLVRLLMVTELNKPEQQRNWTDIYTLLAGCTSDEKKSKDYVLSTFQLLSVSGKNDELEKAVNQACKDYPKEIAYWMAKFGLLRQSPGLDEAARENAIEQTLQEAQRAAGDQAELRLAKAMMSIRLPKDKALKVLEGLERDTEQWPIANQIALKVGLANFYNSIGFNKDTKRLLNKVYELNPANYSALQVLVDLSIEEKDDTETLRLIKLLRDKEGEEGYRWRWCSLERLFSKLQAGERSQITDARKLLDELSRLRPSWNQLATAQGRFLELNGQIDLAIEQFKRAIDQGERNPETVKKTVQLLTKRRRPEEAKEILKTVMTQRNFDPAYAKLATEVSLKSEDTPAQSLEKAKQAVQSNSTNFRDYLWLGNVQWAAEDITGAEASFKRAVSLGREEPEAWASWLAYLVKVNRKEEAEKELKSAEALLKDKVTYVLASYYQSLDQLDKAEEHYVKLVNSNPNDIVMLQGLVGFHFRNGDFAKAESLLKKQVETTLLDTTTRNWARRSYALTLAAKADYQSFKEAITLVEQNLKENPTSPEDLRSRALVLSTRPGPRQDIIKDLEVSFTFLKPNPIEAVLLAQLYEDEGNWEKAKSILAEMVKTKEGLSPNFLAFYIQALIRHQDLVLAADLMKILESKAAWQPFTIEPKARLLFAQGKNKEAVEMLESQANKLYSARKDPTIFVYVSNLMNQAGQKQDAEKMVKQFVTVGSAKIPTAVLSLSQLYARQGRISEAIAVCEENWNKLPVGNVAMVCVAAFHSGKATTQEIQRIEAKLQTELKGAKFDVGVALALADLYNLQKRHNESEGLYRKILQQDKDNVIALNNLAWQLSERPEAFAEAIQLVTKAIDRFGPEGAFLDTRGMIFQRNGKSEQAIKDLEEAVSKAPTPEHWLHLAYAQHKARNANSAEKSWKKALSLSLKVEELSVADKGYFNELDRSYKP